MAALSRARCAHPGGSREGSQVQKDKRLDRRVGSQQQPEVMGWSLRAGLAEAPTLQLCSRGRPGGLGAQKLAGVPFPNAPTLPRCLGLLQRHTQCAQDPEIPASAPQQRTGICIGIWFKFSKRTVRTVPATAVLPGTSILAAPLSSQAGAWREGAGLSPGRLCPSPWDPPRSSFQLPRNLL